MQKTKLKNHKIITTEDGSPSAFSKTYGENFHNTTGARSETDIHYVQGCKVVEKAKELDELHILEVGLGLGIGFEQTYKALIDIDCKIVFTTMEIDEELAIYLEENNPLFSGLVKTEFGYEKIFENFHLEILIGDARCTLPNHNRKYHAIYQDAFSPKRNAILWTTEWFSLLKSKSFKDCIMSTYSSSSSVRKAMLAAGWNVRKGVKFGPKRSSTRAYLSGQSDQDILEHLKRSPAPTLTDEIAPDYHL